jgi:hypothetical protein
MVASRCERCVTGGKSCPVGRRADGVLGTFVRQDPAPPIVQGANPKALPGFQPLGDLTGQRMGVTAPCSSPLTGQPRGGETGWR